MAQFHGEDRRSAAEPDTDALLRMRLVIADAAFVAEGVALGLRLKWAERAPLPEDRPSLVLAWRAPERGVRVPTEH